MECEKLTLLSMIVCPGETISLYGCSVTGILFRENLFQGNENCSTINLLNRAFQN